MSLNNVNNPPSFTEKLGIQLYHTSNTSEARLYGFSQQFVKLNGIKHSVWSNNTRTQKPLLLLLHGFSASFAVWLRFARHFTKHFKVVIPDMAGHGDTPYDPNEDYSIAAQSERMQSLITQLGYHQAIVAGNSMGGFIAAHMATNSESVGALIAIDPAGVTTPQPSQMVQMIAAGRNPFFMHSHTDFLDFFAMVMAKPPWIPGMAKKGVSWLYRSRRDELAKMWKDFNQNGNFLDDTLAHANCPSLTIWGKQDQLIDVSGVKIWHDKLKGQAHVFESLGHMPMIEAPKQCAKVVLNFVAHVQNR